MEATTTHNRGYEIRLVTIFSISWGFILLDRLSTAYMMPVLAPTLGLSTGQVGYLGSVFTVCFALSSIIIGALSDKSGFRKRWLVPCVLATGILSACCIFAQSYTQLLLMRALVGLAQGPIMALIYAVLAPASSAFGRNTGIVNTVTSIVAVTLGPIAFTQFLVLFPWNYAFLISSLPCMAAGIVMFFAVKEVKTTPPQKEQGGNQFKKALSYRNIWVCCLIAIAGFAAYWILMLYAPLYWTNVAGINIQSMGFVAAGMGVLAIVYSFLVPKISDNLGRKPVLIGCYLLAVLAPAAMALLPGSKLSIGAYLLFAGIPNALLPLWMSIIPTETVPAALRGTSNGMIIGVGEIIGGALVPAIAGRIADSNSGLTTVMVIGIVAVLAAAALGLLLKESNPRKRKDAPLITENAPANP